ncbi:MAG: Ribosomal protein S6 kinase alpha-5 [Trichoglossum hirsutum]|nr:MAG: Ribosomal protein S6 kinase alpha-5 [Trichoglossum hirsutum]
MFAFDAADKHFSSPLASPSHSQDGPIATASWSRPRNGTNSSMDENWIPPGFAGESPIRTTINPSGFYHERIHEDRTADKVRQPAPGDGAEIQIDGDIPLSSVRAPKGADEFLSKNSPPALNTDDRTSTGCNAVRIHAPRPLTGFNPAITGEKASRKKKKRGSRKAPSAMVTIKGFTPAASGDEDSDYSVTSAPSEMSRRFQEALSVTGSPLLRPASSCSQGGISALRLKLDTLNLGSGSERPTLGRPRMHQASKTTSEAGSTSESVSDGDNNEMDSYQVPLESDFISPSISQKALFGAVEGGLVQDSVKRKMTASDFEPLRCLGKGTYGTVLLVRHLATGRLYAQKQFRKAFLTVHKKLVEQTKTERVILESVNRHPFVVKLYYAFQDLEKLYLILEYAQGGELFTHLAMERMFSEDVASFYMAEMVLALEHLHRNVGVVYRDLKPENCLLDSEGHLLLTDFGLSKVAVDDEDHCNSLLGTIEYMAPEVILGNNYGMAVDWWSLGALGFDLLTGSPPFQANNHAKIQEKILKQKLSLPYFLSPDAKDLLTRLLRKEPNKRLGGNMPKDLQTIKKHRFFRKIDWKALEKRKLEPPIKPLITDPELAENFSKDFTDLAVSPVTMHGPNNSAGEADPFGGFSYVASRSLLEWSLDY